MQSVASSCRTSDRAAEKSCSPLVHRLDRTRDDRLTQRHASASMYLQWNGGAGCTVGQSWQCQQRPPLAARRAAHSRVKNVLNVVGDGYRVLHAGEGVKVGKELQALHAEMRPEEAPKRRADLRRRGGRRQRADDVFGDVGPAWESCAPASEGGLVATRRLDAAAIPPKRTRGLR